MDYIVTNGPWNVENHMLILASWTNQPLDEATSFSMIEFWVQITELPVGWYSSRIGKKVMGYLKDSMIIQLREHWTSGDKWNTMTKFYRIRISVLG